MLKQTKKQITGRLAWKIENHITFCRVMWKDGKRSPDISRKKGRVALDAFFFPPKGEKKKIKVRKIKLS